MMIAILVRMILKTGVLERDLCWGMRRILESMLLRLLGASWGLKVSLLALRCSMSLRIETACLPYPFL